jgi:hypothetical protein
VKTYSGGVMEITTQADYYGLPEPQRDPLPSQERIAEQLAPAQTWQGPAHLDTASD